MFNEDRIFHVDKKKTKVEEIHNKVREGKLQAGLTLVYARERPVYQRLMQSRVKIKKDGNKSSAAIPEMSFVH